jgi:glycosyltransferase involved in cell wall biosynthesis
MRPIYARAKVLLALSLWWESFGRVAAEAVMNGIAVMHSGRGGLNEATDRFGEQHEIPADCFNAPFKRIPSDTALSPIKNRIIEHHEKNLDSDGSFYDIHSISGSTNRMMQNLKRLK